MEFRFPRRKTIFRRPPDSICKRRNSARNSRETPTASKKNSQYLASAGVALKASWLSKEVAATSPFEPVPTVNWYHDAVDPPRAVA